MNNLTNLKNTLKDHYQNEIEERKADIISDETDSTLRYYSTPLKCKLYNEGKLNREQMIEIATRRATNKILKEKCATLDQLDAIETAGNLDEATITVEWKENRTWGSNPTASIQYFSTQNHHTTWGNYSGTSIGGCGYDKGSTAVAQVLNSVNEIIKLLCEFANENPSMEDISQVLGYGVYGTQYGTIPQFEGGVGTSCYYRIFKNLGYEMRNIASGKTFDVYTIKKQGRK